MKSNIQRTNQSQASHHFIDILRRLLSPDEFLVQMHRTSSGYLLFHAG